MSVNVFSDARSPYEQKIYTCACKCMNCSSPLIVHIKSDGTWKPYLCGNCGRVSVVRSGPIGKGGIDRLSGCKKGTESHDYETIQVMGILKESINLKWCCACGIQTSPIV